MRRSHRILTSLALGALLGLLACGGGPPPSDAPVARAEPAAPATFSAALAWAELEGLVALGSRPAGSPAASAARERIRSRLDALGWRVEDVETSAELAGGETLGLTHLVATLPGDSSDRFVLVAPYDSGTYDDFAFLGVNDGASGAAVLLELARVLALRDFPYSLQLVWLEGEGRLGRGAPPTSDARWHGSRSLAAQWAETGELENIRLLISLNRVCDADLSVARDLGSHRNHREEFWKAARRLGRSDRFERERAYESVVSSHVAFRERGLRPIVAIADTVFGGQDAPGTFAGNEGDVLAHCAPESLGVIGQVTLEALDTISTRLAKIDRFTRKPSVLEAAVSPRSEAAPDAAQAPPEASDAAAETSTAP